MLNESMLAELIEKLFKQKENGNKNPSVTGEIKSQKGNFNNFNQFNPLYPSGCQEKTDNNLKIETEFQCKNLPPGKVWVKNNTIFVEGLPGKNKLPRIQPTCNINLFVNGIRVNEKTYVSQLDNVVIESKKKVRPFEIKFKISDDKLTAYMQVQLETVETYYLIDQEPSTDLVLFTSINKESSSFPYSYSELIDRIKQEGIVYGLDNHLITSFLNNPYDGVVEIAKGLPPQEPRDDNVDVLFPEKVFKKQCSSGEKIDFCDFKSIPSIEENVLMAVRRPGESGKPGVAVTGESLLPRGPKILKIKAGKGTQLEGDMIFSTMPGRPVVKRIGPVWLFYVEPYLTHYGDINLTVGNINFRGNIEIFGDVCDGMTVKAGGDVFVMGCVNRAKVVAMESVCVNKSIGSLIQAGGDSHYISNCCMMLKELYDSMENLYSAVCELVQHQELKMYENQIGLILLIMIEKKFPRIPGLLKDTLNFLKITPVEIPYEIKKLIEMIKEQIPPRNLTPGKVKEINDQIKFALMFFEQLQNTACDAKVDYAMNSIIAATNDVYITGQGCFNSKITAGGSVYIYGVIRGGEVFAESNIVIGEAGSEIGTKTVLKTARGKVKIGKAFDGVIVHAGGRLYEVTKTTDSLVYSK